MPHDLRTSLEIKIKIFKTGVGGRKENTEHRGNVVTELGREISKLETIFAFGNLEELLMVQYSFYQILYQNIKQLYFSF